MKKLAVATATGLAILAAGAGSASAHVHTIEQTQKGAEFANNPAYIQKADGFYYVALANGAGHPGFKDQTGTGVYVSTGFDTYINTTDGLTTNDNSANSGYGLETAHHGADQGTPGKSDDTYVNDGPAGKTTPDDDNPAIQ